MRTLQSPFGTQQECDFPGQNTRTATRLTKKRCTQIVRRFAVVAFLMGRIMPVVHGCNCVGGGGPSRDIPFTVSESDPFVRIWLYRRGDTGQEATVSYATGEPEFGSRFVIEGPVDTGAMPPGLLPGIARAAVDYRAVHGTITFAPGQTAAAIEIPLIDNGLVDGARDFVVWITEWPAGTLFASWVFQNYGWIRIEDNEVGSSMDPLFVPPTAVAQPNGEVLGLGGSVPNTPALFLSPLPRGRLLTEGGSQGLIVLGSDGREDLTFAVNLGRQGFSRLTPLAGLADDGVIAFVDFQESNQGLSVGRLVRFNGDGTFGAAFVIAGYSDFVGVQRSGRILVTTMGGEGKRVVVGYDQNGRVDTGFRSFVFAPATERGAVQLDSEDRIIVLSQESDGRVAVARFDPDGTLDPGFLAPVLTERPAWQYIRSDDRIIIGGLGSGGMVQLGHDGAAIEGAPASIPFNALFPDLGDQWVPRFEGVDGSLLGSARLSAALGAVVGWNPDGTLAGRFVRVGSMEYASCCYGGFLVPQLSASGAGPLVGYVNTIEGIPCRGLARLLVNPPERDFRVLAPAEISSSSGTARLRVLRTGPTLESATVRYRTQDGDAIAGREYEETSGVLVFAPLEVSKEVVVPLKAEVTISGRRSFNLQLEAPSAGYGVIPTTPVVLVPALSLEFQSANPVALTVHGTLPGATYALEFSEDLVFWQRSDPVTALDSSLKLAENQVQAWSQKSMFYRIAR